MDLRIKHGHSKRGEMTRTYLAWRSMRKRCTNDKHPQQESWVGRGITVCKRWDGSFEKFLADMGVCPVGLTLERKNNDKGYYKRNCKWATTHEQARNRRSTRMLTFQGETMCMKDWADRLGVYPSTISKRLLYLSVAKVLGDPDPTKKGGRHADV